MAAEYDEELLSLMTLMMTEDEISSEMLSIQMAIQNEICSAMDEEIALVEVWKAIIDRKDRVKNGFDAATGARLPTKMKDKHLFQVTRLRKHQFMFLYRLIEPMARKLFPKDEGNALPLETRIGIYLHRGAHRETYRQLGLFWECSAAAALKSTLKICIAVLALLDPLIVRAQSDANLWSTLEHVQSNYDLPACAGFVDGTLLPRTAPRGPGFTDYLDRKKNFSLNVQVVAGSHRLIVDKNIGHGGSAHDASLYTSSNFGKRNESGELTAGVSVDVGGTEINPVFVGDQAYPASEHMLVGKKGDEVSKLDRTIHGAICVARATLSEGVFGVLKKRWRYLALRNEDTILNQVILADSYCVINNFVILTVSEDSFQDFLVSASTDDKPTAESLVRSKDEVWEAFQSYYSHRF